MLTLTDSKRDLISLTFTNFFSIIVCLLVPPSWIKEPKDVNIRAGEEYSVECLADGLPKPKITWNTPSGKRIDNEVLNLNQLIKSEKNGRQSLQFECVADNGIGDALRKTITVSYNGKFDLFHL